MHATRFLESYLEAWNHHNPEGVAAHLSRDGVYCDVPEQAERKHDELIESLGSFFAQYHHRYELAGPVMTTAESIAFQYRMMPVEGGCKGDVHHGAEFITLAGDGALLIRDYYDVPAVGLRAVTAMTAELPGEAPKYAKSGLGAGEMIEYKARLEGLMQRRQVFLQSDLTLPGLARMLDCSVNHLSQVINAGFGTGFFDYLNRHRIAYAKRLLTHSDQEDQAIMNVAFAVGFNSNSAFYAAFKKHVGQTPARYRRGKLRNAGS